MLIYKEKTKGKSRSTCITLQYCNQRFVLIIKKILIAFKKQHIQYVILTLSIQKYIFSNSNTSLFDFDKL